jgi:hypothetical protein
MPIKDMSRYPKDWKAISLRVRERDGWCCKFCGLPNHSLILRRPASAEYIRYDAEQDVHIDMLGDWIKLSELPDWTGDVKYTKVVLTVAHLGTPHPDGTPGDKHDKLDCRDENLAALCQRCHLLYDMDEHVANRQASRRQKHEQRTGQKPLFEVNP